MFLSLSLFSLLPLAFAAAVPAQNNSSTACNNSPALCSRSYSNITQLGAHDSAFLRDSSTDNSQSGNQLVNTTLQLAAGVRLITAQLHNNSGSIHLCHTSCNLLDAGPLHTWLAEIKAWMDTNPNDVVTVLLVNSDSFTAAEIAQEYNTAGIASYGFIPAANNAAIQTWPTLQTLIDAKTRLINFIADIDPTTTAAANANYLLDEFIFVFENPFDVTSATNFSCIPDRPPQVKGNTGAAISSNRLSLVNHFLDLQEPFGIEVPDIANAALTNANNGTVGNLGASATQCAQAFGKQPNYLLVDFFDQGPAITTVDKINGITPVGRTSPNGVTSTQKSLGNNGESRYKMISNLGSSPLGILVLLGIGLQVIMAAL